MVGSHDEGRSVSSTVVLETDDVAFSGAGPDLDLDEDEPIGLVVGTPVGSTTGHEDEFPCTGDLALLADGARGHADEHQPMPDAVDVNLERQPRAGRDRDPLDLVAIARSKDLPRSPGAVLAVQGSGCGLRAGAHGVLLESVAR
jgi:hypothetical protein